VGEEMKVDQGKRMEKPRIQTKTGMAYKLLLVIMNNESLGSGNELLITRNGIN
jgi:hypothetical protein